MLRHVLKVKGISVYWQPVKVKLGDIPVREFRLKPFCDVLQGAILFKKAFKEGEISTTLPLTNVGVPFLRL
jgi:hypothetical protein